MRSVSTHRYEELVQWNWSALWSAQGNCFYAARRGRDDEPKFVYMHRYITSYCGKETDHWNHNTLDNGEMRIFAQLLLLKMELIETKFSIILLAY